ncbi:hypothetical protein PANO111632_02790 [Paracoccus nototheniae]
MLSVLKPLANAAWNAVSAAKQADDPRSGRIKELAFAADALLLDQPAPRDTLAWAERAAHDARVARAVAILEAAEREDKNGSPNSVSYVAAAALDALKGPST